MVTELDAWDNTPGPWVDMLASAPGISLSCEYSDSLVGSYSSSHLRRPTHPQHGRGTLADMWLSQVLSTGNPKLG